MEKQLNSYVSVQSFPLPTEKPKLNRRERNIPILALNLNDFMIL